ncbi:hypothetical protein SVAN01_07996 [Stagonosporopsis vannaccii]|nr:hypothetical protein SVAN01_07996 [Stagonosporopsis vannaccii]
MLTMGRQIWWHKLRKTKYSRVYHFKSTWRFVRHNMTTSQRALYAITCQYCSPLMRDFIMFDESHLDLIKLRTGCQFCEIVRQTMCQFEDVTEADTVVISFRRTQDAVLLKPHRSGLPDNGFIQIHSRDRLDLHNPFPSTDNDICMVPSSACAIKKVQGWLTGCEERHSICTDYSSQVRSLPRRLLHIVGPDTICLVVPSQPTKYSALSYCWGQSVQPKTTRKNQFSRLQYFNCREFPQTLKDAIYFTYSLGVEYIWIDCLCIVQDDADDWAAEAARLADIYSGAWVVLAATRSNDVAQGFLQSRPKPVDVSIPRARKDPLRLQARNVSNHSFYGETVDMERLPLFQRGWCMQERLLACRIIHFLPDEIFYECRQDSRCECGLSREIRPGRGFQKTLWPSLEDPTSSRHHYPNGDAYTCWDQWHAIAQSFSKLQLTYAYDALPALSGIAKRALLLRPGTYLAGVWEIGIAFHLSWRRCDATPETKCLEEIGVEITPTFSWISCRSPIEYHEYGKESRSICKYLHGESIKTTVDPFGRISHASICLEGYFINGIDLVYRLDRESGSSSRRGDPSIYVDSRGKFSPNRFRARPGKLSYENLMSSQDWSTVKCFGLVRASWYVVTLLLLLPVSDGSSFVRIGLAEDVSDRWFFQRAVKGSVTIM